MKTLKIAILFFLAISLMNCDDEMTMTTCGDAIIIDNISYETILSDDFGIDSVYIDGNCLTATINYSGSGNENLISYELMASTIDFPVTLPALLKMKIVFEDNDDAEALITTDIHFDLSPLQNEGYNNLNVAFEDYNVLLQYAY